MSIIIGFILDCIFGDPYNFPHPVRLIGKLISNLEKLMRNLFPEKLYLGGILMSLSVMLISTAIPLCILAVCYKISVILGIVAESVMCWYLIASKCLKTESMKVYKAVSENDINKSRKAVSMIVGRDTEKLDFEGII